MLPQKNYLDIQLCAPMYVTLCMINIILLLIALFDIPCQYVHLLTAECE